MKNLTWRATAATSAALAAAVFVSAQDNPVQNPKNPQQNQNTQQNVQRPQPNTRVNQPVLGQNQNQGDSQLAACLIVDNEGEIAIAKFVASKSQNSDVKEFAETMVAEHEAFLKKLSQFSATSSIPRDPTTHSQPNRDSATTTTNRDNSNAANNPNANRDNTAANNQNANNQNVNRDPNAAPNTNPNPAIRTNTTAAVAHGGLDHIRIKQEIGRACVETMKKELGDKKGAKFDECYVGSQIGMHLHMADTLKVLKNYASPQLRAVLEEGEKTTAEHLDHARTLMKDLEKDSRKELTSTDTK